MKFCFFVLLLFINVTLANAVSFSPSSLVFNQKIGERTCQNISFEGESDINAYDKWALNKDVVWNPNLFNESSSLHELSLEYKDRLANKGIISFCLSGNKAGEYHGILFLSEEQKGNSIVRMGVWIKAVISDSITESNPQSSPGITGGAVGSGIMSLKNIIIGLGSLIIVVIIIIGILAYQNVRRKREWNGI